ncbi:N-acetylmuramoyl-L-alanine amidase [Ligilactobacillus salivarius]|jgi:N-acetylmuramoyl-L-alanine amidase|nr:N-acetylmuramoyl-L-alanine amidase [Ligilactobacillus salivarius]
MQTGFQNLAPYGQNKIVYYNKDGQLQYGLNKIDGYNYLFDKSSGAMQTGLQNLAPYGQNKTVYFASNGQMQYGQKQIDGHWYLFNKDDGAMQTGFQDLTPYGQNKVVYYASNGQMQYGQQAIGNHWYLFSKYNGAMQTGFQNLAPYGQDKIVYYNKDGQLQYGSQVINGKKYYFDKSSGKMYTGVAYNADTRTIQYYATNGQMQFGKVNIAGKTYDFDDKTGNLLMQGLVTLGGKNYLLNSNYKAITGQQVIGNHWYLFSKYDGSMQTGFQDLTPYGQNKTVYYATNGQMQYGKQNIDGHWYLFDQYSGAMYKGWLMSGNDWYYYNQQNGQLQTGSAVINGVGYNFDGNGKQILNYSIDYRYALPAGKGDDETAANNYIILHDVGVESGAAANARYFHDTVDTNESYVTFVVGDGGKVYQVGRPGQVSWGAGRVANHNAPVQIELGRTYNSGQFWQDYVTYVRVARDMAGKYGIPLALDAGGAGTRGIKSHYWVTKNIWGDHVDPYGYLSRFGVTQAKLAHDLLYGV